MLKVVDQRGGLWPWRGRGSRQRRVTDDGIEWVPQAQVMVDDQEVTLAPGDLLTVHHHRRGGSVDQYRLIFERVSGDA